MKSIPERYFALLPTALVCLCYSYQAITFQVHDFANYYFGGAFLTHGTFSSNMYFPEFFNQQIAALGHREIFAAYAPNTPFLAVVFAPLSWLSMAHAKLVFNAMSVILFLFAVNRLASFYKIRPAHLIILPILFLVPIKNNLLFGQVYFLIFFLLAEAWLCYEKGRLKSMSLFLALAILIKVFPILLLCVFIFRKQYKPILYTALSCAMMALLSGFFTGFQIWAFYLGEVLPKAANGEIATAFVDNYQSIFMFLKRIFVFDPVENPGAPLHTSAGFAVLVLAWKTMLLAIGFYISKKMADSLFVFSYWIVAMILASPYGSTYTMVLLVIPFFWVLKNDWNSSKKGLALVLLFGINNLPLSLFIDKPFPVSFLRLLLLVLLFSGCIWMVRSSISWKMVLIAAALPLLLVLSGKQQPPISRQFLSKNAPILIYDYTIRNNALTYFYRDEEGHQEATIPMAATAVREADVIQNQIYFFGKLLIANDSHKRKPIVINGKTLLYLSDEGRGIGFYTLRKIDIK